MTEPPERIYGWMDSQLSLARYSGGCTFNGHAYTIAYNEDRQPLVRWDVLKREAKAAKEGRKAARELTILEQVDADLFAAQEGAKEK